ncbi:MAG: GNAT family N-acetyltransferase [Algoriphagus sp.]|nr:GNAT family N-acetyltransferase [Algoriphagus sp.]
MIASLAARIATHEDQEVLWGVLEPMIRMGGTYVFSLDKTKESMMAYWMGADKVTFAVENEGVVVGTFYLKANQEGLGDHICNAGFVVSRDAEGLGVGRWMGEFAQVEAKSRGFLAMQFNFVIQSNQKAVHLWKSLGFSVIGEIPEAYRHPHLGLVPALIFYKKLTDYPLCYQ